MKIGIRRGSMGNPEMDQLFAQVAEIGFDGVELEVAADYEETMLSSDEGRAQLKQLSADSGVAIPSLCVGALWQSSPAATDESLLERSRFLIEAGIAAAADLGAAWMLVPIAPSEEEISHEECTERWIREMKRVAPVAEQADVILCPENVGRGCGKSAEDLKTLADGAASSHIKTYYDIGNATAFENDPVEEIKFLGDLIGEVHVKDREGDLLGDGIVDIRGSLAALKEIGYDDWLVLETPATDDPMAAGEYNLEYLQGVLADLQ